MTQSHTTFEALNIRPDIRKALAEQQYEAPTPIQTQAIPAVLAGRDLLGCAQTGTGKTAAFALPILQLLMEQDPVQDRIRGQRRIRSLVLTPTRELALQIADNVEAYSRYIGLRGLAIVGGVSQAAQEKNLRIGADMVIATPGRLLDLMGQKLIDLRHVRIVVLDEADRMLDMGFIRDVQHIVAQLPARKQTLLFSATMPKEIAKLAESLLNNPAKVEITPVSTTAERIEQSVYKTDKANKTKLLLHLLQDPAIESALVFTRTKHGADRVARDLTRKGIAAQAIHGNKSQNARQTALNNFKSGATRVLVATDIAARGIDIEELSHVINFNLPNIPETYVHRIGRTGRAGLSGTAISFCEAEELPYLKDIEKLIRLTIPEITDHPFPMTEGAPAESASVQSTAPASGRGQQGAKSSGGARRDGAAVRTAPAVRGAGQKPRQQQARTSGAQQTGERGKARQPSGKPGAGRKPGPRPTSY